LTATSHPVTPA